MPVVTHNLLAQFTDRQLNITNKDKQKSTEKLSSGYRINRSADDAAGLQISEKMRWQVRGLGKATNNCEGGVSFCQVADGAMEEIEEIVQRMRELSVQAANDTNTKADRYAIQDEIVALSNEVARITTETKYNTKDVFGIEREITNYVQDSNGGWTVSGPSQTTVISGNNYGLAEILGKGKIYTGFRLDDKLQFAASGWKSTGEDIYSYPRLNPSDLVARLNSYTTNTATLADLLNSPNGPGGTSERVYSDVANGYRTTIKYDPTVLTLDGRNPVASVTLEKGSYSDPLDPTSFINEDTIINERLSQTIGSNGYANGKDYGSAWIDFSGLGTDFTLSDLYGQGFNSTCATCSRHYSISFTGDACDTTNADGVNYTYHRENWNSQRLEINISGCTTGKDIVDSIYSAVSSCSGFQEHYTQYAVDSSSPAKLYIYDNRNSESDGGVSTFEPAMRNNDGQIQIGDTVVTIPPGNERRIYSTRNMWIQSGTTNLNGFFIERPMINASILGIMGIGVLDYDSASAAIATCDSALEKLNDERTKVGAQQNRLEKASLVDANTQENTQAAESRLRDVDMAEEMVQFSKHSILQQAGQTMLTQANQQPQQVLALLQ